MYLLDLEFYLDIFPGVGLLGHMVTLVLVFKETPYCFPQWLHQSTFPSTVEESSLFSTPSPALIIHRLFNGSHPDWCEVIPQCSFDLHFSNNFEHLFTGLLAVLCLLWRNLWGLFRSSAPLPPFLIVLLIWFDLIIWSFCIFWKLSSCWLHHLQIFFPSL